MGDPLSAVVTLLRRLQRTNEELVVSEPGRGNVVRVSLASGTPLTLASSTGWGAQGLGVDSSGVYFAASTANGTLNTSSIMWHALGGTAAPTQLVTGLQNPADVALGPNDVFWVDTRLLHQVVQRAPKTGGTPTTLYTTQNFNIRAVAADSSGVYWTESGAQGGVWFVPAGTTTPQKLTSTATSAWELALDPQHLYWLDDDDSTLLQGPRSVGVPTTLATGQQPLVSPQGLATDGSSVYWAVGDILQDGSLMKIDLASPGAPVLLAHGAGHIDSIALDATSAYLATNHAQLMKLTPR